MAGRRGTAARFLPGRNGDIGILRRSPHARRAPALRGRTRRSQAIGGLKSGGRATSGGARVTHASTWACGAGAATNGTKPVLRDPATRHRPGSQSGCGQQPSSQGAFFAGSGVGAGAASPWQGMASAGVAACATGSELAVAVTGTAGPATSEIASTTRQNSWTKNTSRIRRQCSSGSDLPAAPKFQRAPTVPPRRTSGAPRCGHRPGSRPRPPPGRQGGNSAYRLPAGKCRLRNCPSH